MYRVEQTDASKRMHHTYQKRMHHNITVKHGCPSPLASTFDLLRICFLAMPISLPTPLGFHAIADGWAYAEGVPGCAYTKHGYCMASRLSTALYVEVIPHVFPYVPKVIEEGPPPQYNYVCISCLESLFAIADLFPETDETKELYQQDWMPVTHVYEPEHFVGN